MFTINVSAGLVFGLGIGAGILLSIVGLFVIAAIVNKKVGK